MEDQNKSFNQIGRDTQSNILPKEDMLVRLEHVKQQVDGRKTYLTLIDENGQSIRATYEDLYDYIRRRCIPSNLSPRDMYSNQQTPTRISYENHVYLNEILENGNLKQTRLGSLRVTETCDLKGTLEAKAVKEEGQE